MKESQDLLKLRVLLCFLYEDKKTCTVSGVARMLGKEKYAVSRVLTAMEEEGLVDRSNNREPKLTEQGLQAAQNFAEKVETSINHLMFEGVDAGNAREDAMIWALYNSDRTMDVIRKTEIRYKVKYDLRNIDKFDGETLCKNLPDGVYDFPFMIYRGKEKNGNIISMANEAFLHPCTLSVQNSVGEIQLRAQSIRQKSRLTGNYMEGSVNQMKYLNLGHYVSSQRSGEVYSFPASVLQFRNIGSGFGQILHGSVCMKMTCSVGNVHMPESVAIFTILI